MKNQNEVQLFEVAEIQRRIMSVRSVQVMLDRDLAELYGVELKALNQAVKRNAERFPERFMHQLTKDEFADLKSQIATSSQDSNLSHLKSQFVTSSWGGVRKLPKVFTEQGVSMLSAVLHSPTAIDVSIRIMDAFVAMRRYLMASGQVLQQLDRLRRQQILDQSRNDERFDMVFTALASGNLLPSGILPAGSEYDSLRYVSRLVGELPRSPSHDLHDTRREGDRQAAGAGGLMGQLFDCLTSYRAKTTLKFFKDSPAPTKAYYSCNPRPTDLWVFKLDEVFGRIMVR